MESFNILFKVLSLGLDRRWPSREAVRKSQETACLAIRGKETVLVTLLIGGWCRCDKGQGCASQYEEAVR